jgi:hypothetical protein
MKDWRRCYNEVRPHGSMGNKPPLSLTEGSSAAAPPAPPGFVKPRSTALPTYYLITSMTYAFADLCRPVRHHCFRGQKSDNTLKKSQNCNSKVPLSAPRPTSLQTAASGTFACRQIAVMPKESEGLREAQWQFEVYRRKCTPVGRCVQSLRTKRPFRLAFLEPHAGSVAGCGRWRKPRSVSALISIE